MAYWFERWTPAETLCCVLGQVTLFSYCLSGTRLYTWVKRGTVRVKCLAQEHNVVSLPRLEPRPLDRECSTITTRPPRLPLEVKVRAGNVVTYPSPNLTLTLNTLPGQNVMFGEGQVGTFPETYIDP